MNNPIHESEDGWYFWDETGAYQCGPYDSAESAVMALNAYCRTALSPNGTKFKHCATCKAWEPDEEEPDVGTCTSKFVKHNTIDPTIGGIAIHGEYYTHAIYGCVNHKLHDGRA